MLLGVLSFLFTGLATASSAVTRQSAPTVQLDRGTFIGTTDGTTNKFLGIPYTKPPVGELRLRRPVPAAPYTGVHNATTYGPSCNQQTAAIPIPDALPPEVAAILAASFPNFTGPESEDCLSINVIVPANTTSQSKLPVAVWIYGGGFEFGASSMYDGTSIVQRSIALDEPVIYVSMNYRLSGWGFLGGKEVKKAGVGNLGLQDQRQSFRWIQKYIRAFGGDPTRVTIWGESAGSISVALHMVTNGGNTEGLFHGGFMESGSAIPVGDITQNQVYYDSIVNDTGCSSASDTLECLRHVNEDSLRNAINKQPNLFSYQALKLAFSPQVDGVFLTENPQVLVTQGSIARIPIVNGDCDDEGTLFTLPVYNITTTDELHTYLKTYLYRHTSDADIDRLLQLYPQDPAQGSPFDTGDLNVVTPQNKRIAAIFGDIPFHATRRFLLDVRSEKQNIWSFLSKRFKAVPVLGAFHGTDLTNVYGSGDLTDFLVNFVNNLDPNGAGGHLDWPKYTPGSPNLMTLLDGATPEVITQDTFRIEPIAFLNKLAFTDPPL